MTIRTRTSAALLAALVSCSALFLVAPAQSDQGDPTGGGGGVPCLAEPEIKKEGGDVMARITVSCRKALSPGARAIHAQVILNRLNASGGTVQSAYSARKECGMTEGNRIYTCTSGWAKIDDPSGTTKYTAFYEPQGVKYVYGIAPVMSASPFDFNISEVNCGREHREVMACPTARQSF